MERAKGSTGSRRQHDRGRKLIRGENYFLVNVAKLDTAGKDLLGEDISRESDYHTLISRDRMLTRMLV